MKILFVNVFRSKGSTGSIVSCLGDYMKQTGHTPIYCYREGPETDYKENFCIGRRWETAISWRLSYLLGRPYGFAWFSTLRLLSVIKKTKPDLVNLHSINGSYVNIPWLIGWLKKHKIPVVIVHHSEYLYTGNCTYAVDCMQWEQGCRQCAAHRNLHLSLIKDQSAQCYSDMKRAFSGISGCSAIAVSDWVRDRARRSAIMQDIPHYTVENCVDETVFYPRNADALRRELGIPEDRKVVFLSTAYFSDTDDGIKGGKYIVALAKALEKKNVTVVIASLSANIKNKLPENILLAGSVSNRQMLAEYYSLADVAVIVSKRETFSMPVAEALMCGTPVAGFCAGGPETIAIAEYSRFVEYGDIKALGKAVTEMLEMKAYSGEIAKAAGEKFTKNAMCELYTRIFFKTLVQMGR